VVRMRSVLCFILPTRTCRHCGPPPQPSPQAGEGARCRCGNRFGLHEFIFRVHDFLRKTTEVTVRIASRVRLLLIAGIIAAVELSAPALAAEARTASPSARQSTELSAQQRRPRTRIVIRPSRLQLPPNAVRECEAWLAPEFRPSGTVIVPAMRCRWVRG